MSVLTIEELHKMADVHTCMNGAMDAYNSISSSAQCLRLSGRYDGQVTIRKTAEGRAHVAFRGSESTKDWLINLSRNQVDYPPIAGAGVHAGFLRQHDGLWEQIVSHLQTYETLESHGILVTGHSLGGGLATLFYVRIASLLPSVSVACYVFGAPRVGNQVFVGGAKRLDNLSMLRVNNAYDLIPQIPIRGYVHTSNVVTLPTDQNLWWFQGLARHSMKRMCQQFQRQRTSFI